MMLLNKLKLPVVVAVLAVLALAGVGLTSLSPTPQASAAPVPKSLKQPVGRIGVHKGWAFYLLRPDGATTHQFDVRDDTKSDWLESPYRVCPSPNGFPVAVLMRNSKDVRYKLRLFRSSYDLKGEVLTVKGEFTGHLIWSRTGKRFYASHRADQKAKVKYLVIDPATGKTTASVIPEGHWLVGEAADGTLVTTDVVELDSPHRMREAKPEGELSLARVSADGKTITPLKPCSGDSRRHTGHFSPIDLSPDGHTVLSSRFDQRTDSDVLFTFDTDTGETTVIRPKWLDGMRVHINQTKWSPDGKRVGLAYEQRFPSHRETCTLSLCDLDGSNDTTVFIWKHPDEIKGQWGEAIDQWFEWN